MVDSHTSLAKVPRRERVRVRTPEEYAFTYLNFSKHAEQLGRTGGFAHVKTLLDHLRQQAGGRSNTLTVDGGDLWQSSATSLWTQGCRHG